jgi:DNA-binding transcriptional regulator YdaS (Cro superfamily)
MSRSAFADLIGISESHLSLVLQRKRGMSLDIAVRIERETEGAVTAAQMQREAAESVR